MVFDRKKPGVAFWATVVVAVVLVGYPLSFGPACWWFSTPIPSTGPWNFGEAPAIYMPIGWIGEHGPKGLRRLIHATR
jgi:hypothetical protein